VSDGTLAAPFDGVVLESFVEAGEFVRSDSPVLRIATLDSLVLETEVPEAMIAAAAPGTRVSLQVAAFPGRSWSVTLEQRGVAVRERSRDVVVEGSVANPDGVLLPGMFGAVDVPVGTESLPIVPASAVIDRRGRSHVFVVRNRRAEERAVALGAELPGDRRVVVRGLSVGEELVLRPPPELENGGGVE
jgi:RND family efflux transporter MFP subunit